MSGVTAPYLEIASVLRGELATAQPGDRVPSTREIKARFGVAMATATKVVNVLKDEGLVLARPGVGTVVSARRATRRPAASPEVPGLTRDRVVAAAVAIADAEGLGALSMRRVATELGVAPMSLYRHVADKDALLVLMLDAVLGERPLPKPEGTVHERLEAMARLMWDGFRRHRWLAGSLQVTRPQLLPRGMALTDWSLAALEGTDLTPAERMTTHLVLFTFLRGLGEHVDAEALAEDETGIDNDEWAEESAAAFAQVVQTHGLRHLAEAVQDGYDFDLEQLFQWGLAVMLAGVDAILAGAARRRGSATAKLRGGPAPAR